VQRLTAIGWALVLVAAVTAVLALVAPAAALVAAVVLVMLIGAASLEGFSENAGWFDIGVAADRKVEALSRNLKLGRRKWETRAPDFPDEPVDEAFARERARRQARS